MVDFYDSKLSVDETRNALVNACESDFALVGTGANFLTDPEPLITCPDEAGRPTGIPDLTTFSLDPGYQCSPVSFQILPPDLDCSTINDKLERYRMQVGTVRYFQRRFGDLHGIYVLSGDLESVRDAALPQVAAWTDEGVKQDGEGAYFVSSVAPRSAFTPDVQVIKDDSSNFVYLGVPVESIAAFRQEAKVQGVDTVKAWTCAFVCYDRTFVEAGGADVDGQLITGTTLPFEEAGKVPALARYLKAVGPKNADGFGVQAWIAGMLFEQVADGIVKTDGVNGLTRGAFLGGLRRVHTCHGRRDPRDDRHRQQGAERLLPGAPGERRRVRAGNPEEAGHLRLQAVQPAYDCTRPPGLEPASTDRSNPCHAVQLALNVDNLDAAIDFYSRLFHTKPAKVREGYANFAIRRAPAEARARRGLRHARLAEPPRCRGRDDRRGAGSEDAPHRRGARDAERGRDGVLLRDAGQGLGERSCRSVVGGLHRARRLRRVRPDRGCVDRLT